MICRTVVIFRPTHLQTKLEPSEVEFTGDFYLGSLREFVTKNMYVFISQNHLVKISLLWVKSVAEFIGFVLEIYGVIIILHYWIFGNIWLCNDCPLFGMPFLVVWCCCSPCWDLPTRTDLMMAPQPPSAENGNGTLLLDMDIPGDWGRSYRPPSSKRSDVQKWSWMAFSLWINPLWQSSQESVGFLGTKPGSLHHPPEG